MKLLLLIFLLVSAGAQAQWTNDPKVNTPVFAGPNTQSAPIGVSDGQSGAFVFWFHQETGQTGIFAQRIDASGSRQFPPPVPVPATSAVQIYKRATTGVAYKDAIEDGAGGAIITWSTAYAGGTTGSDIYAQQIDATGNIGWTAGGVTVCDSPGTQIMPRLVSDGSGGAIIVWEDHRLPSNYGRVYAQRIKADGTVDPGWPAGGKLLSTKASQNQSKPILVSSDNNSVIVVWEDVSAFQPRLYAQKVDNSGVIQWPDTGVVVDVYTLGPILRGVVGDGAGGAYVCWQDIGTHGEKFVYVRRIDAQGNRLGSLFPLKVSNSDQDVNPLIVPDGNGGAIIAWEDSSNGSREVNIYAQRISPSDTLLWISPLPVSVAAFEQYYFSMIPRGNDGAIIAWTDARFWPTPQGLDVYAQSFDNAGNVQWQGDGTPISQPPTVSNPGSAQAFPKLISDGKGGAIVVWQDGRNGSNSTDIYTQGLAALGLPFSQTIPIVAPNTNYSFIVGSAPAVTVNFNTLGSVDSMTVEAYLNAVPPGLAKALPRYLQLTADGSGFDVNLTFNYTDQEVQAAGLANSDANLQIYRNSGSGWVMQGGTVDTQANTITINNVTGFSLWAIRDPQDTLVTGVNNGTYSLSTFALEQNYPNPFNPATTIRFSIRDAGFVSLNVYDAVGRVVRTLVNGELQAGSHEIALDATGLASGVYFYRLESGGFIEARRFVLVK